MNTTITQGQSILSPPYFDGTNYNSWKEHMIIFIKSMDFKLWLVIKNGPRIPKKQINDIEIEKCEEEFNDEDMKDVTLEAKAKNILYCAINQDMRERLSTCNTAQEMWDKLSERYMPTINSTSSQRQINVVPNTDPPANAPSLEFLEDTRESMDNFTKLCVPLHKLALEGNWPAAKRILNENIILNHAALATGWPTVLHVAAGTNHVHFVKGFLEYLDAGLYDASQVVQLQDAKGNTAFCYAAAFGNMDIVNLLLDKNPSLPTIRGVHGKAPIHFAASQGQCEMTWFLYGLTKDSFEYEDWKLLFFTCINTGIYHLALKMVTEREELAYARDVNEDTALHILAEIQKPLDSCSYCLEHEEPIMINPGMKQHVVFHLAKCLWTTLFRIIDSKEEIITIIDKPFQLLFDAAEVGNFGFLSELISAHPSLIWEVDNKNHSIIHTAVSYRHANIFNLIHDIGPLKDIIVMYGLEGNNTILHLAGYLAPRRQLELISGAAFQMCNELIWFERVKKITPPELIKWKNSEGLTAQELFTREHKELRKEGEAWMKRTAEFGMLVSTVIATGVFSAAINIPGGIDDASNKPNYLGKTPFMVFAISDAIAFISSSTSALIFLSILVSRYAEYDFYISLPLKLISGLLTLFFSITSMMVAFGSSFFITYFYGSKLIPDFISAFAFLPILLYIALQCSLWWEIIYSIYYCWALFKPSKRMIYLLATEVEALQ